MAVPRPGGTLLVSNGEQCVEDYGPLGWPSSGARDGLENIKFYIIKKYCSIFWKNENYCLGLMYSQWLFLFFYIFPGSNINLPSSSCIIYFTSV